MYFPIIKQNIEIKAFQMFALLKDAAATGDKSLVSIDSQSEEITVFEALRELDIKYESEEQLKELNYLLKEVLSFPSNEDAEMHEKCNRLGPYDLADTHPNKLTVSQFSQLGESFKFCSCCGFIMQQGDIEVSTSLDDIPNLGISTFLYFRTLLSAIYLIIVMLIVYSIFSIGSNLLAAYDAPEQTLSFQLQISLATKHLNSTNQNLTLLGIQIWLGVVFITLWLPLLIYFKKIQTRKVLGLKPNSQVYERVEEAISAADFTVLIENAPHSINEQKMQAYFNNYQKQIFQKFGRQQCANVELKIAKFNVGQPFYLSKSKLENQELTKLSQKQVDKIKIFSEWILQKKRNNAFTELKQIRDKQYIQYQKLQENKFLAYKFITNNIVSEFQKNLKQEHTNTIFVTFTTNTARNMILQLNGYEWTSEIRDKLFFCCNQNRLKIKNDSGVLTNIKIMPAPEPEDIIWMNLGHSLGERAQKKLFTFVITLLLLLLSFIIVYSLSVIKKKFSTIHDKIMSYLISLVISVFNILIQVVIRILTSYQKNHSQTSHQMSLAVKSVFALLINSIIIPIITNLSLSDGVFVQNGLIANIFTLSITNSFLSPTFKIFNPIFYYNKFIKYWKSNPQAKLGINQTQLNELYSRLSFQAGYQYVYLINIYLFTCFFVTLQPIISVFAVLGLVAMFWSQKYSLFHRCKRPVPGNQTINTIMFQFIYLGPLTFSLGNLFWMTKFEHSSTNFIHFPILVSFIVSFIILLLPYDMIFSFLYRDAKAALQMKYEDNKIYFPSQYDRLNPVTAADAIKQHLQYTKKFKQEMLQKNESEVKKVEENFLKQVMRGFGRNNQTLTGEIQQKINVIEQLFGTQGNVIYPIILGNALLSQSKDMRVDPNQTLFSKASRRTRTKRTELNNLSMMTNRNSEYQEQVILSEIFRKPPSFKRKPSIMSNLTNRTSKTRN